MPSLLFLSASFTVAAVGQLPVAPPTSRAANARPQPADLCPLSIYIDAQGRLSDSRFNGRYRVTEQTLRSDLAGGCKEKGPTSSVRIQPSPQTKFGRLKEVLDLVQSIRPDIPVTTMTPNSRQHR